MGLKDAFRSLRGERTGDGPSGGAEEEAARSDVPEPMAFQPRFDGVYSGRDESGLVHGFLRFSGSRVFFAPGETPPERVASVLGPGNADPWSGDYTKAGRFTVQRRFERPIVHTVLEFTGGGDAFVARYTPTADHDSLVLTYSLLPTPSAEPSHSTG